MPSNNTSAVTVPAGSGGGSDDKCHKYGSIFLLIMRGITIIALLLNLVSYILLIKIAVTSKQDVLEKTFLFLSSLGMCLMLIALGLAELQFVWFLEYAFFLKWWPGRGFSQAWVGINTISVTTTLGSAVASEIGADEKVMTSFSVVVGWILLCCGLLLCLMSLFCVRKLVDSKADQELEQGLLDRRSQNFVISAKANPGAVVSKAEVDMSEAQAKLKRELEEAEMLLQNLSTCMGMAPMVAKSKFGGRQGAQAAENFQREMAQKEKQLRAGLSAAGASISSGISSAAESASIAMDNRFTPSAASSSGPGPSSSTSSSSTGGGAASSGFGGNDPFKRAGGDDDAVPRRKRATDDDELERMYYGNK